jgi:hypothetical protein
MEKAVIDRFEGEKAVLLVGETQTSLVVDRSVLPEEANEGTWLRVEIEDGVVASVEVDESQTRKMSETIADKLARLRRGEQLKK